MGVVLADQIATFEDNRAGILEYGAERSGIGVHRGIGLCTFPQRSLYRPERPIVILLEDINGGGGGRKPVKHDLRDDARARTGFGCAKQPGGKISDVDVQLKTRGYHRGGWRFAKQRRAGRDLQVAKTPGFL